MTFIEFMRALAKATGVVFIIGLLTMIVGRALWIRWSRRWQFVIKYNIMKAKVDPIKAEWIIEALRRGLNYDKMKMKLLIAGFQSVDIYEILWLSLKFSKELELKGGQDGRKFERSDCENESRKLPIHSKGISKY